MIFPKMLDSVAHTQKNDDKQNFIFLYVHNLDTIFHIKPPKKDAHNLEIIG